MRTRRLSPEEAAEESARERAGWLALYQGPDPDRAKRAADLTYNGARGLLTAHVMQNLKRLDELIDHMHARTQTKEHAIELLEFAAQEVYDQVKIISFFESWMKAILLARGYWIHGFEGKRLNPLRNAIKKRPQKIADVLSQGITAEEVSEYTIGMSTLLDPAYLEVIGLPIELTNMAFIINDDRGKIHLKHDLIMLQGKDIVNDLRKLKNYATSLINKMHEAQQAAKAQPTARL
ncbi:MAG: hypothetical protein IPF41_09565 [Flavobacteriales bacterium]|nr:hypothetical protein [Flavobacteriales bacterium]